ncbi:MAG: HD domain-containing protein [Alphaproteobacteria bacterium]|nr:HD domain-containing protein [Alphaproteobacteria bacterium]
MRHLVDFLQIAEKLECEYRLTRMSDGAQQAVASHSWSMALMAIVLRPYLKNPIDMERVLKMCLLHDLPEAIAHDVPLHEQNAEVRAQKHQREADAVAQILSVVDNDDMRACLDEYEMRTTPEARLVKALDVLDTGVQHMCAKDLQYIGEYADNFYWRLFFDDKFAKMFDFEPVLRQVFDEIRERVVTRLRTELNIDVEVFRK